MAAGKISLSIPSAALHVRAFTLSMPQSPHLHTLSLSFVSLRFVFEVSMPDFFLKFASFVGAFSLFTLKTVRLMNSYIE